MDPLLIYVLVLAGIIALSMALRRLVFVSTRRCFMCDTRVPVTERRCRYCGYYFEAVTQTERKGSDAIRWRLSSRSSASPRSGAR